MKNRLYVFFFFALVISGCKKESAELDLNGTANFKIVLTQTGKFEGYQRLITLEEGMVYEGTNQKAIVLSDEDIPNETHSFTSTEKLKVFEPSFKVGWYGFEPAEGFLNIKVYRNEILIDSQNISLKPENAGQVKNYSWTYPAK